MAAIGDAGRVLADRRGSAAQHADPQSHGCKRQFDSTVQTYLRTTDRRDARGFNALLHKDVIGVLPGGAVFDGRTEFAVVHHHASSPARTGRRRSS